MSLRPLTCLLLLALVLVCPSLALASVPSGVNVEQRGTGCLSEPPHPHPLPRNGGEGPVAAGRMLTITDAPNGTERYEYDKRRATAGRAGVQGHADPVSDLAKHSGEHRERAPLAMAQ